jgi:hypothetical protein
MLGVVTPPGGGNSPKASTNSGDRGKAKVHRWTSATRKVDLFTGAALPAPDPSGAVPAVYEKRKVGDEGLEPPTFPPGKTTVVDFGGASGGALPADLVRLIDRWPTLADDQRARIMAIVDGRRRSRSPG